MHTELLAWYPQMFGWTPYRYLNRRRWPWMLAAWGWLVAGTIGLAAGTMIQLTTLAAYLVPLEIQWKLSSAGVNAVILTVLAGIGVILVAPFALLMRRYAMALVLGRAQGRCLNCGATRESEFLDTCSACAGSLREQTLFKQVVEARRTSQSRERRITAGHPELVALGKSASRALYIGMALVLTGLYISFPIPKEQSPSPAQASLLVGMELILLACTGWAEQLRGRYRKALVAVRKSRLLAGQCGDCGAPVERGDLTCHACGSSIFYQRMSPSRPPTVAPFKGLTQRIAQIEPMRQAAYQWFVLPASGAIITAGLAICLPAGFAEDRSAPPPVWMWGLFATIGLLIAPALALEKYDACRRRHNLERLVGRCLECEAPLDCEAGFCGQCGSSILAQERYRSANGWFHREYAAASDCAKRAGA